MSEQPPSPNDELAALVAEQNRQSAADDDAAAEQTVPVVALLLANRWFSVAAGAVRGIVDRESVTRVPSLPSHVLGVSLVLGRLVPVVDLLQLIGIDDAAKTSGRRLVVLQHEKHELAVIAEEARGVVNLPATPSVESAQRPHPIVDREVRWEGRLVGALDVPSLFAAAHGHDGAA